MSENKYVITNGILGNNVTDDSPTMQGLLAAYPYLMQGTNQHFYPNQKEAIGNQLYMGFGSALNTPQDFQNRVEAPFTKFEGAPDAMTGAGGNGGGDPTGFWYVPTQAYESGGPGASGYAHFGAPPNQPGAQWVGGGNPYSDANVRGVPVNGQTAHVTNVLNRSSGK